MQTVADLVSSAMAITEEFSMEDLEAMLREANKSGPRNLNGQPVARVYIRDFVRAMQVAGLIDSTA